MKAAALVAGALIIGGFFAVAFASMVRIEGWRVTATLWGITLAVLVLVIGAAFLISYGLGGFE